MIHTITNTNLHHNYYEWTCLHHNYYEWTCMREVCWLKNYKRKRKKLQLQINRHSNFQRKDFLLTDCKFAVHQFTKYIKKLLDVHKSKDIRLQMLHTYKRGNMKNSHLNSGKFLLYLLQYFTYTKPAKINFFNTVKFRFSLNMKLISVAMITYLLTYITEPCQGKK